MNVKRLSKKIFNICFIFCQITEEVYQILRNCPYEFQCRGKINVKGKGEMTTYFLLDRKQSTTMRIDEVHPTPSNLNRTNAFGGIATPLAYLQQLSSSNNMGGGPPPAVPPRNPNSSGGSQSQGIGHRSITMPPEHEPLLPPPPPPPRNQLENEMAWPRMVKVYPLSDRRTSPVKRTHSDRVTPTREVSSFCLVFIFILHEINFITSVHRFQSDQEISVDQVDTWPALGWTVLVFFEEEICRKQAYPQGLTIYEHVVELVTINFHLAEVDLVELCHILPWMTFLH